MKYLAALLNCYICCIWALNNVMLLLRGCIRIYMRRQSQCSEYESVRILHSEFISSKCLASALILFWVFEYVLSPKTQIRPEIPFAFKSAFYSNRKPSLAASNRWKYSTYSHRNLPQVHHLSLVFHQYKEVHLISMEQLSRWYLEHNLDFHQSLSPIIYSFLASHFALWTKNVL